MITRRVRSIVLAGTLALSLGIGAPALAQEAPATVEAAPATAEAATTATAEASILSHRTTD